MLKAMKKAMCRILVFAMILTVVSVPAVSTVGAAEESNVIWETHYEQDFDKLTALVSDDKMVYTADAAALKDDSTGGKYLELTPQNAPKTQDDGIGTGSQWSVLLKAFDNADKANKVRLEYKVKFINHQPGEGVGNWAPYSNMSSKIYASGRMWSARISPVATKLLNLAEITSIGDIVKKDTNNNNWYDVAYEFNAETGDLTSTVMLGETVIDTKTASGKGAIQGYLMGCDASGNGVYVDNIKVSYGYIMPEDFEENFDAMTELTAKDGIAYNVVENTVDGETVKSVELVTEGDNKYIKVSPKAVTKAIADASGETQNWCVNLSAFQNSALADYTTLSFKIKFTDDKTYDTASTNKFDAYQALSNKVYAEGTTRNWSVRISPVLLQFHNIATNTPISFYPEHTINGTTKNMDALVSGEWYTINLKYGVDKSGDAPVYSLISSIVDKNNKEIAVTEESTSATGPITSYVFGVEMSGRTTCIDDIKVTYSYDEEETSPVATVKVYADGEVQSDLENASMLTDKVVVSFSEEMKPDTINENTVYVENANGDKVICGAELDSAKKNYTLTFPSLLAPGAYKVVVTDGAMSAKEVAATATEVPFTVTDETPELPQQSYTENYVLNFDNMETGAASNIDGVIKYNSGVGAKIVSGGVTGNCLSVVPENAVKEADGMNSTTFWSVFFNKIDTNTNADRVKIEYDVKLLDTETESSTTYGGLYAGDKEYSVKKGTTRAWANRIGTKNSNLMEDGGNIGSAIDNLKDWVKVTYLYDKAANTMTGSYSQNGVTINSGVRDMTERGMVKAFILGSNTNTGITEAIGEEIYLDNIAVTYIYNKPIVSADSITVADVQGADQDNWNAIDPLTKSIKIDFGAVMDTATLNNTNIYLSKDGGTTKVAYIPSYENGVYTMSFTENLEKKTKYTLYIAKDVANVTGVTLDAAVPYDITTGKGVRKAELMAVKVGDNKVTSVGDLKNVTSAKLEIDYSNTTGEDQKLNIILAFYAGDTLKKVELLEPQIDGDVITMTYSYDFNMPTDMSDVTAVKVMAWSTFGEMIPLSDSIDI